MERFEGIDDRSVATFRLTFEKRHPITHNLGIVDRKYLNKVRSGELEGRDVPIAPAEVTSAIDPCRQAVSKLYTKLFTSQDYEGRP